jgi:hypothetical protein
MMSLLIGSAIAWNTSLRVIMGICKYLLTNIYVRICLRKFF